MKLAVFPNILFDNHFGCVLFIANLHFHQIGTGRCGWRKVAELSAATTSATSSLRCACRTWWSIATQIPLDAIESYFFRAGQVANDFSSYILNGYLHITLW